MKHSRNVDGYCGGANRISSSQKTEVGGGRGYVTVSYITIVYIYLLPNSSSAYVLRNNQQKETVCSS